MESLEQELTKKDFEENTQCPVCLSKEINASNIRGKFLPGHNINDIADFECYSCGYEWSAQYGYKGK